MSGILTLIETGDANATPIQANLRNKAPVDGSTSYATAPVTGIEFLNDGRAVAGVYTLTFPSATPGSTATCVVTCTDTNNPYHTAPATVQVALNDNGAKTLGTRQDHVIGGVGLWFSSHGDFQANTWYAIIVVGGYFDGSGTIQRVTTFGTVTAGTTTDPRRIGVKNTGDQNCESSKIGVYPGIYFKNQGAYSPLKSARVLSKTATPGKYVITINNYSAGSGTANAYLTQYAYNPASSSYSTVIRTLDAMGAVHCDGTTQETSVITGLGLTFNTTVTAGHDEIVNVYIESAAGVYIAPDSNGTQGTYTDALDVALTQSGGATGLIQPNNTAYFWLKIATQSTDTPGNIRKYVLRPSAVSIGGLSE